MLKKMRVGAATALFVCENLFFIGVGGGLGVFEKVQLVPALLAANIAALILIAVVTLVFGRLYCSTLCPLGVFQDLVIGAARVFAKKRFAIAPAHTTLRYVLLALVGLAFACGIAFVPALVDPYSLYGRIATHLLQPAAFALSNAAAWIADRCGHPLIFKQEIFVRSLLASSVAFVSLVGVGFLSAGWGRLYCNTVCPVGSLLAVLGHRPLFRIAIDGDRCVGCGLCERACKAACIDAQARTVDVGRCVACFDCLGSCRKGAIRYTSRVARIVSSDEASGTAQPNGTGRVGRRGFVTGAAVSAAAAAAAAASKDGRPLQAPESPVSPPGSGGGGRLLTRCTACNLCVAACEGGVLKPALLEYGLGGMMMPRLDFSRGFCGWDCNACGTVCPNGAILPLALEEKRKTKIGRAVYVRAHCVLVTDGVQTCGNCAEHCPTKALTLVEEKDKKKYPRVDENLCIGCGACEYHCPSKPFAIRVVGLE
ncbi:MAG TPA: 4Fe-4S dicluster domain-containing protein [Kiritimatiellia bacterium]|nr:4Fe-4S dicluster domain-containing protein [Kiritimatiellia bacterium]HPS08306.1 4Fe-4S dicluster domain-containing protein [Kiritimatiellia bacterium]